MKLKAQGLAILIALGLTGLAAPPIHAQDFDDVQIETTQVGPGVYMLTGSGGNLAVSVGEDGVFLVDDQYAPLTEKILAAIRSISDEPVRFVINTHWHGDHVGGNENIGQAGALILAHDNVRKRMSVEQFMEAFDRTVPASPLAALPVVTFSEAVTFHINGGELHAFHVDSAHTDGDAMIHFRDANVIHMGDVYFNGLYPFVDFSAGGSIDGIIAATKKALEIVDDDTRIIPGHGPLSNETELEAYLDMLVGVRDAIWERIAMGSDRDAVIAAEPTARWDEAWGAGWLTPEQFVGIVYSDLSRKK